MISYNPDTLSKFFQALSDRIGCLYIWPHESNNYSGKDLSYSKYKHVYDCSGLVTSSLFEATGGAVDWRANHNAQSLFGQCRRIKLQDAIQGDLGFYGPSLSKINHVVVYLGLKASKLGDNFVDNKHVVSASGGTSRTVKPEIAMANNAYVRQESSLIYRKDFLCVGRLFSDKAV